MTENNLNNENPKPEGSAPQTSPAAMKENKKLFYIIIGVMAIAIVGLIVALCILAGYNNSNKTPDNGIQNGTQNNDAPVISVIDGYIAVNGVKTEHKVHIEPVISVIDGYVAINGVKTEYEVNKADVITVEDGYVVVNGRKTEHKVHTEPVISVIDGYIAVNGVKTEYEVELSCDHDWQTATTPPTCTEDGYDIMTCSFCNKSVRTNITEAASHKFPSSYMTDDEYHWLVCTACGDIENKATHSLDDEGVCTICNLPISSTPGVVYDISADGPYAEVVGYTGTAKKVKIAEEYNGLHVKVIYEKAFYNNDNITSVVIPDSVTSIGDYAFAYCPNFRSVVIGDSVTSIGDSAFVRCPSLSSVVIGEGVTSVGVWAFYDCTSLSSIVIPDSVTNIGEYAFCSCSNLSSIIMGNSVTSIGNYTFCDCTSLSSIVIPDSVTNIGEYAFYECYSLSSVVIGDSVTRIGDIAFANCYSLSSVVIPDSVTSIGRGAFSGCHSSLCTEYEFGKYVRSGDNPYAVLIEVTNKNMSSYTIHENTKVIAYGVFSDCSRLTEITIPDSVTSISASAFAGCSSLKDVYYTGSEEEWKAISIGRNNYDLTSATKHYNYIPE